MLKSPSSPSVSSSSPPLPLKIEKKGKKEGKEKREGSFEIKENMFAEIKFFFRERLEFHLWIANGTSQQ